MVYLTSFLVSYNEDMIMVRNYRENLFEIASKLNWRGFIRTLNGKNLLSCEGPHPSFEAHFITHSQNLISIFYDKDTSTQRNFGFADYPNKQFLVGDLIDLRNFLKKIDSKYDLEIGAFQEDQEKVQIHPGSEEKGRVINLLNP
jgi:hypothetical protein